MRYSDGGLVHTPVRGGNGCEATHRADACA
uniref:Uncharacterized protein n=1 Tax=Anopheles quadriannulatus TaxID=34691 RepID=A0A182XT75_ANOQN